MHFSRTTNMISVAKKSGQCLAHLRSYCNVPQFASEIMNASDFGGGNEMLPVVLCSFREDDPLSDILPHRTSSAPFGASYWHFSKSETKNARGITYRSMKDQSTLSHYFPLRRDTSFISSLILTLYLVRTIMSEEQASHESQSVKDQRDAWASFVARVEGSDPQRTFMPYVSPETSY